MPRGKMKTVQVGGRIRSFKTLELLDEDFETLKQVSSEADKSMSEYARDVIHTWALKRKRTLSKPAELASEDTFEKDMAIVRQSADEFGESAAHHARKVVREWAKKERARQTGTAAPTVTPAAEPSEDGSKAKAI